MRSQLDQQVKKLDEMVEEERLKDPREASLEQNARQPRLALEADSPPDTKTREHKEGTAKAVHAMYGDSCAANRVDPDPMCSTSFGDDCTPALPCSRENALVDNGAAVPKSCLPSLEMCSPTAAGGLLPPGEASIVTRATYNNPPLRLYSTEETNPKKTSLRTPILSVSCDSSFRRNKLLAVPSYRRVIETKYGQNRMFDPGGSQGHPRACPFLATWRALLFGDIMRVGAAGDDLQRFQRIDDSWFKNSQKKETNRSCHTYCDQSFFSGTAGFKK